MKPDLLLLIAFRSFFPVSEMQFKSLLVWLCAAVVAAALSIEDVPRSWENTNYSKAVDVSKSYAKERHDIVAKNIGSQPESVYVWGVPRATVDDITLVMAMAMSLQGKKSLLKTSKLDYVNEDEDEVLYYAIELPYPVAPQSEIQFTVSAIVTDQIHPYPPKIELDDDQTVRVQTSYYPISPYETLEYSFGLLGTQNLTPVTDLAGMPYELVQVTEDESVFQSVQTIPEKTFKEATFSFVKNSPLKHVNFLKRDLWISHWSDALELEEYYELTNKAAELANGFNRAQWFNGRYALKQYFGLENLRFPIRNKNIDMDSIYFTDKVGNVSTSQIFNDEIIFKPRFPLFGNWNYNFTLGWDLKLSDYLRNTDKDEYTLQVNLLDGMTDTSYSDVSLNVYLPEGAEYLDSALPFNSIEPTVSSHYSYMDYNGGHTCLEFKFDNLVDELRNFEIVIKYKFTKSAMLRKPLTCALFIFIALVSVYLLKMVDLSIEDKEKKQEEEEQLQEEQVIEEVKPVTGEKIQPKEKKTTQKVDKKRKSKK